MKIILLLFPILVFANETQIGGWKNYQSYNSASYISETKERIYCVANGGLFFINKSDNTIKRLSKIDGLSDVKAQIVGHSEDFGVTVIVYENCNVDLLKNDQIINIPDIKRKEISGLKVINNITIKNNIAYLSSTFGLILIDIIKNEIKDTYSVNGPESCSVNGCAFLGDSIIVATSNGVFFSNINSQSLSDYNNWEYHFDYENEDSYDNIISVENELIGDFNQEIVSISYNNNTLIKTKRRQIECQIKSEDTVLLNHIKFENIKYCWADDEGNIWVADSINGLLKFVNYEYIETFNPEGPTRNDLYSLEYHNGKLYVCHGGHENFGVNSMINDGVSIKNNYDEWINYNSETLGNSRDILEVAIRNGSEYFASWYHGIIEIKNGVLNKKYGNENTNGALDTCYYSNNRIRISDIKFDAEGNLWALSSEVNHPIVTKTPENNWYSFSINQNQVGLFLDDLLIDVSGQKWGIIGRGGGVLVFNNNNTISNAMDDQYKILNTSIGNGNLPSNQTYCIAEDLDNQIWVGTDKGIGVFYNPQDIFSGYSFDSEQIIITEGDYGQYLFSEEKVKCIVVDGANRKWVGTEKSGVFLISEDGRDEILHFTANNSPIPSNNIIDIAINHLTGEVFIGTEKGLISYRADATKGVQSIVETQVFPNPVTENYFGPIAINGLVVNSNVKITDITGNLIFETMSNGGQAIWNGRDINGNRVGTGVYLVFSTDVFGEEKIASKILFIH